MGNAYSITDACVGCTLCARRCPVKAIHGELKQKHEIDQNLCIRCGVCGRLCMKGAVLNEKGEPAERIPESEWKKPGIMGSCAGCSVCLEACPVGCLSLSEPKFHGDIATKAVLADPEKCLGCGLCQKACPIGAIRLLKKNESISAVLAREEENTGRRKKPMLYTAYCRVFQACMKIGNYFVGYRMPEYIEGPGSIRRLPALILEKGVKNVLVVTDNGLMKLGLPNGMLSSMEEAGIKYTVFSDIAPNPTSDNVEQGVKIYKESGCEALVAFGGGAPMDCAKAIGARIARPRKSIDQLQGLLKILKKIPLLFAVPTTSGTGSETTLAAVITDATTHRKASINDPNIIPKYAVLDPELTCGLPPFVTATTGMDALCHAVESYINGTYCTQLENRLAKDAVRLIYNNLLTAYRDGKNLEARQNMQKASFFAGRAFTRGCVGYVHAVGHTLGGLYGVPHGLAMSVILPHVLRQYGSKAYHKLSELADVCGISGSSEKEKALMFIDWIEQLKRDMDIPVGVDMIRDEDIPQMVAWALKETNPLYPVPVVWGKADVEKLINTIRVS